MFVIEKSLKPDHLHHIRGGSVPRLQSGVVIRGLVALRHLTSAPRQLSWKVVPGTGGLVQLHHDPHLEIGVSDNLIAACRPELNSMCSETALQVC